MQASLGNATTLTEDVWIDAQGRVRRVTPAPITVTAKDGSTDTVTTTIDMYDFGTAVSVAAPPAAETTDGTALAAKGLAGQAG